MANIEHHVIPRSGDREADVFGPLYAPACPLERQDNIPAASKPVQQAMTESLVERELLPPIQIGYDPQIPERGQDPAREEREDEDHQYEPLGPEHLYPRLPRA